MTFVNTPKFAIKINNDYMLVCETLVGILAYNITECRFYLAKTDANSRLKLIVEKDKLSKVTIDEITINMLLSYLKLPPHAIFFDSLLCDFAQFDLVEIPMLLSTINVDFENFVNSPNLCEIITRIIDTFPFVLFFVDVKTNIQFFNQLLCELQFPQNIELATNVLKHLAETDPQSEIIKTFILKTPTSNKATSIVSLIINHNKSIFDISEVVLILTKLCKNELMVDIGFKYSSLIKEALIEFPKYSNNLTIDVIHINKLIELNSKVFDGKLCDNTIDNNWIQWYSSNYFSKLSENNVKLSTMSKHLSFWNTNALRCFTQDFDFDSSQYASILKNGNWSYRMIVDELVFIVNQIKFNESLTNKQIVRYIELIGALSVYVIAGDCIVMGNKQSLLSFMIQYHPLKNINFNEPDTQQKQIISNYGGVLLMIAKHKPELLNEKMDKRGTPISLFAFLHANVIAFRFAVTIWNKNALTFLINKKQYSTYSEFVRLCVFPDEHENVPIYMKMCNEYENKFAPNCFCADHTGFAVIDYHQYNSPYITKCKQNIGEMVCTYFSTNNFKLLTNGAINNKSLTKTDAFIDAQIKIAKVRKSLADIKLCFWTECSVKIKRMINLRTIEEHLISQLNPYKHLPYIHDGIHDASNSPKIKKPTPTKIITKSD